MKKSEARSLWDKTKWYMPLFVFQIFRTIEMKAVNLFMFSHKDLWLSSLEVFIHLIELRFFLFFFFCQSVNIRHPFLPAWTKLWMEQRSTWHLNFPSVFPFNLSHSFSLFSVFKYRWLLVCPHSLFFHSDTHRLTHIFNCLSPFLSLFPSCVYYSSHSIKYKTIGRAFFPNVGVNLPVDGSQTHIQIYCNIFSISLLETWLVHPSIYQSYMTKSMWTCEHPYVTFKAHMFLLQKCILKCEPRQDMCIYFISDKSIMCPEAVSAVSALLISGKCDVSGERDVDLKAGLRSRIGEVKTGFSRSVFRKQQAVRLWGQTSPKGERANRQRS